LAKNDTLSSILTGRSSSSVTRTGNVALGESDGDAGGISALPGELPMQAINVARLRKGCLPICVTQVILLLATWGLTNPEELAQQMTLSVTSLQISSLSFGLKRFPLPDFVREQPGARALISIVCQLVIPAELVHFLAILSTPY
jgi:hypothetical protein